MLPVALICPLWWVVRWTSRVLTTLAVAVVLALGAGALPGGPAAAPSVEHTASHTARPALAGQPAVTSDLRGFERERATLVEAVASSEAAAAPEVVSVPPARPATDARPLTSGPRAPPRG